MLVIEHETRCDLCRSPSDELLHGRVVALCTGCAVRVGDLALATSFDWLPLVWKVSSTVGWFSSQPVSPTAEELETHADLAHAYAQMDLLPDAMQHAAWVLTKNGGVPSPSCTLALDVLFGEHLAHPGALEELRRRWFVN